MSDTVACSAQVSVRNLRPIHPPPDRQMAIRARSPDAVHIARVHDKNCLRCKFIRHKQKWNRRLLDGGEAMIIEQPDPKKPWGLGCVVCSRYHAWLKTDTVPAGAGSSSEGGSTCLGCLLRGKCGC